VLQRRKDVREQPVLEKRSAAEGLRFKGRPDMAADAWPAKDENEDRLRFEPEQANRESEELAADLANQRQMKFKIARAT
jgi:hypothetical protein